VADADSLEKALCSDNPEQRRLAAADIDAHRGPRRVSLLMAALGDSDWRVRKEATCAAIRMAPDADVLDALVLALGPGDNVGLRNAAVEALAGYGADAVRALKRVTPSLDADGRKLAAEAMGRSRHSFALPALRRMLEDEDPNVRATAVEAIATAGVVCVEEAVPILQQCLRSDDPMLRLAAITGLNELDVALPWETVEFLLLDPVLERSALVAAGRTADAKAAPLLVQALEAQRNGPDRTALAGLVDLVRGGERTHAGVRTALGALSDETRAWLRRQATTAEGDTDLQRMALVLLGLLGTPEAAKVVVDALSDVRVAAEAEEALVDLGPTAVPVLVERARRSDEMTATCLELLGRIPAARGERDVIEIAVLSLESESAVVVRAAFGLLGQVGDAHCLEAVANRLGRSLPQGVRKAACSALTALSRQHEEAARALARQAEPEGVHAHAAVVITGALGSVRGSVEEDVAFLAQALGSELAMVRRAAVDAVAEIGSPLGVEPVAFALTDEDRGVQLAAVRALGRMRTADGAAAGLEQLLRLVERDDDDVLVVAAIRAVGESGDPRSLSVLRPLVRQAPARRAVAAVEAVARLNESRRVDALIDGLSHQDAEVVKAALLALAEEIDPRAFPHLGACLDHPSWDVRRLAADLLGRSGGGEANLGILRAKLAVESETLVREAIQRALAELEAAGGVRRSPVPGRPGSWRPR
jgi:HEAT repeat protein